MEENVQKLIKQFKIARIESGKSGYDIEFATGITQSMISNLERGQRMCRLDTLVRLADHLGYELVLEKKCEK